MKNNNYSKTGFLKQACEAAKYAGAACLVSSALFMPGCMSEVLIPRVSKESVVSSAMKIPSVVKPSPKESIDSICEVEQVPSNSDSSVEASDAQIHLVQEYIPPSDDSSIEDYASAEPVHVVSPVYVPQADPVEPKIPEPCSLPAAEETPVLKDLPVKNGSIRKAAVQNNCSVDSIVSGNAEKSISYWMAKKSGVYSGGSGNSENIPSNKAPFDFGTTVALSALASLGSSLVLRYFLTKKSSSLAASVKQAYSFIRSLPELSKPGIFEESVRDFIQKYSSNTPALASHFAAKAFMDVLPDANQFSNLDLIVFANTVKNHYSCDDAEFCTGVYRIVENYDRSVVGFDVLLKTVVDFNIKKGHSKFSDVAVAIGSYLGQLNSLSKKQVLSANRAEYRARISKAETAVKRKDYNSAISYFKEALVFNRRRSEAYFGLSDVYLKQNFLVDAAETLDDLIDLAPCRPVLSKAYLARASCFVEIGNAQAALGDVKKADCSQLEKYVLEDRCYSMLNTNSVAKKVLNTVKKAFNCYAVPGLMYWASTKKQNSASRSVAIEASIESKVDDCVSEAPYSGPQLPEGADHWEYWAGLGCQAAIYAKSDVSKCNDVLFNFTQAMNRAGGNVKPYLDFGNICLYMLQGDMADDAIGALSDALDKCRLSWKEKRKVLELRADLYKFTGQRKAAINDWKAALGGWTGWIKDLYSGAGLKRRVLKNRIRGLAPYA